MRTLRISEFEYELPPELIADKPADHRELSRLLVLDKNSGERSHSHFCEIGHWLRPGDLLVMNNSRVMRARLYGTRVPSGGKVEALLLEPSADACSVGCCRWVAMCRPAKRLVLGERVRFGDGAIEGVVRGVLDEGQRVFEFPVPDILPILDEIGELPLPPYIVRRRRELGLPIIQAADDDRYQTVYARPQGSVAAPTAGLHFTSQLLDQLRATGIETAEVTLHVGAGTFKPVEVEDIAEHKMHTEHYTISDDAANRINQARREGRRVVAVGTTTTRCIEASAQATGCVVPGLAATCIMIAPGYKWRVTDALITNFHLPRSTLLLLVSALASREAILDAYAEAVRMRYRFFSYGDAMFIH